LVYFPTIDACYIREFDSFVAGIENGRGLVLDRSAFYPRGGGQNADKGYLIIDEKEYEVNDVVKKGDRCIHLLSSTEGIAIGDEVHGVLDWDNRYGNMRMHTAQHLISAIVKDRYGADTVGNQLYPDKARMDFSPLTKQDFEPEEVACEFTEMLLKDLKLSIRFEERSELLSDRKVRVALDRLPPNIKILRVVEIEDYDICPCAGTHIRSLGELIPIEITRAKSKGKGRIRVEYWFQER